MQRYNPRDIEPKWQKKWEENGIYTADLNSSKPKYIAMSMFNYPSGAGIHIGHAMNYTISDVKARFMRQKGYESYHPVGWDAFGLPAENYAIKAGVSPQASMAKIIPDYHKQYKAMGWSNDWSKEISTHEPLYYKWTQWIFSQMYKHGLAYQDARMQWWCTKCQTVLANEQVIDGKCWRHDGADDPTVEKKEVKQWFFKITEYADELLEAIDDLDWTESVKLAQKNWIGKSIGAEINFEITDTNKKIKVFTTRPDTLFGATFMVIAPEHELVSQITTDAQKSKVETYVKATQTKTEVERQANKQKTGVFTGAYATNPANGEQIPVWIADYVLTGYGTGAIMAVPAHDERDFEFAVKFGLPIQQVFMESGDDPANPPQEKFKMFERKTVVVHLRDRSTGKYALLNWHGTLEGITTAIMGGIDEGETAEEAALREISEEAGIHNAKIVKTARWISAATYCASHKQENRKSISTAVLAEVDNLSQQTEVADYEKKTHTLVWATGDAVEELLIPINQKQIWNYLQNDTALTGEGEVINSGEYDGLLTSDMREKIVADLTKRGVAQEKVNYKMRDWSVSRQRYWGAPIPIVNCPTDGVVLLPDEQLPVVLPELEDFQPSGDGRSALARAKDWLETDCPKCGGKAERETDTLDTYICSSWYMFRYFDPKNDDAIFDTEVVKRWEPIDFYNGADHAIAHLLYARFIARFFTKLGLVDNPEPFKQFLFNGKVTASDGTMFSKSKGNGVDPLEIIEQGYGADALRTYLMFTAPLELWAKWDPQGVPGTHRFLSRIWTLVQEYIEAPDGEISPEQTKDLQRTINQMIKKMTEDIHNNLYNTAIAAAMGAVNSLYKLKEQKLAKNNDWQTSLESLVACVAPFAPHIADELWQQLGHNTSVHKDSWPQWDDKLLVTDKILIVVQVNGKVRAQLTVAVDSTQEDVELAARANEKVAGYLAGKTVKKTIYVPGKLVSFVV